MFFAPNYYRDRQPQEEPRQVAQRSAFTPSMNKPVTTQYLAMYMREPAAFRPEQVIALSNHAAFYGLPFQEISPEEARFNIFRALRYAGEGWLSGFSTLNIGKQPVNVFERVARSIGTAAGYAGYIPSLGLAPLRAAGKVVSGKSVPLFLSGKIMKHLAPAVNTMTQRIAGGAILGQVSAAKSAANFLLKPMVQDVAMGAARMSISGAVSSWQGGIDSMLKGFTGGLYMETGDRLIANIIGKAIGGASGGLGAQAIARTLAGAMWNGLPSTARNDSTPEQVYQYLLGGFFAYRDKPVHERWGEEAFMDGMKKTLAPKSVTDLPTYKDLPEESQTVMRDLFDQRIGSIEARNTLSRMIARANFGDREPEEITDLEDIQAIHEAADKIAEMADEQINERTALEKELKEAMLEREKTAAAMQLSSTQQDLLPQKQKPLTGKIVRREEPIIPVPTVTVPVVNYTVYGQVPKTGGNIINTLRQKGNNHFGNPFTGTNRGVGTIAMGDIQKAVDAYIKWLEDPDFKVIDVNGKEHSNIKPEQRQFILDQIDSGAVDGKTFVYFKPKRLGEYRSHADALAEFVANRRSGGLEKNDQVDLFVDDGYKGYAGGFDNIGKGTPDGDGKDKAMRQVADAFIGEIKEVSDLNEDGDWNRPPKSSTETSLREVWNKDETTEWENHERKTYSTGTKTPKVVMLARNSEFKDDPLSEYTMQAILDAHKKGASFVVGDMPGVDGKFIEYLQEIGAKFTVYHTGDKPRIIVGEKPHGTSDPLPSAKYKSAEMQKEAEEKGTDIEQRINKSVLGKIDVSEEMLLRIRSLGYLPLEGMSDEQIALGVRAYTEAKLRYVDSVAGKQVVGVIPESFFENEPNRLIMTNMSTAVVTDRYPELDRAVEGIEGATGKVNPIATNANDVVTFLPGKEALDSTGDFTLPKVNELFSSGAVVLTDDAWVRHGSEYWAKFEETAKDFGYSDDNGTGIWIKKTLDSADNKYYNEYRKQIIVQTYLNAIGEDVTPASMVRKAFKNSISGVKSDTAVKNLEKSFYTFVDKKNPFIADIDSWAKSKGLALSESDRAALINYVVRTRTLRSVGVGAIERKKTPKLERDASGNPVIGKNGKPRVMLGENGKPIMEDTAVIKFINPGTLVGDKKIGTIAPIKRALFNMVPGLEELVSEPVLKISAGVGPSADGKEVAEDVFPRNYEDFQKAASSGAYGQALKQMLEYYDPIKKRKIAYFYVGGRNDKEEMNFLPEHPELVTTNPTDVMREIASKTGRSYEDVISGHKQDMLLFYKTMYGVDTNSVENIPAEISSYYWRARVNNLLYLRDLNGFKDFGFVGTKGFLKGASDFNKRLQIILNNGSAVNRGEFVDALLKRTYKGGYSVDDASIGDLTVAIADIKSLLKRFGTNTGEAADDGDIYVLPEYLDSINEVMGLPVSGGVNKSFITHSDGNGMLLGKYLFHKPTPELEAWMRANGLNMVADDNGIKQLGNRKMSEIFYNDKTGAFEVAGELSKYTIPVESINVVMSEISDASKVNKSPGLTKQAITNFGWVPKSVRAEIVRTLFQQSADGTAENNAAFERLIESKLSEDNIKFVIDNIDDVSVSLLSRALGSNNEVLKRAIISGILGKKSMLESLDVAEGESEKSFGIDTEKVIEDNRSASAILFDLNIDYALYDKYSMPFVSNAINKYFISRATRPHPGNAVGGMKLRGYLLSEYANEVNDDSFYLGKNMRRKEFNFYGEKKTFEELWREYDELSETDNPERYKQLDEFFGNIGVQRVPQDSAPGFQVLHFAGFIDVDSNEIIVSSNVKEALGGADDDGDSAYLWFGGRNIDGTGKGFKSSWLKSMKKSNKRLLDKATGKYISPKNAVLSNGESAKEATLGKSNNEAKRLMSDPVLLGAPGIQSHTSVATVYARHLLSEVVTYSSMLRVSHTADSDLGGVSREFIGYKKSGYGIVPKKDITDGEKMAAAAITSVADPTDFDSIPNFDQAKLRMFLNFYEVHRIVDGVMQEEPMTLEQVMRTRFPRKDVLVSGNDVADRNVGRFFDGVDLPSIYLRPLAAFNASLKGDDSGIMQAAKYISFLGSKSNVPGSNTFHGAVGNALTESGSGLNNFGFVGNRVIPAIYKGINESFKGKLEGKRMVAVRGMFQEITKQVLGGQVFKRKFFDKTIPNNFTKSMLEIYDTISWIRTAEDLERFSTSEFVTSGKFNQMIRKAGFSDLDLDYTTFSLVDSGKTKRDGSPIMIPRINIDGIKNFETLSKKLSGLVNQDLVDMATYKAMESLLGDKQPPEVLKRLNEIWLQANRYKSAIATDPQIGKAKMSLDEADMEIARYIRDELKPGLERDAFNVFMLGSWRARTGYEYEQLLQSQKDAIDKAGKNSALVGRLRPIHKNQTEQFIESTDYSSMGLTLRSIPDSAKKSFYGIIDGFYKSYSLAAVSDASNPARDVTKIDKPDEIKAIEEESRSAGIEPVGEPIPKYVRPKYRLKERLVIAPVIKDKTVELAQAKIAALDEFIERKNSEIAKLDDTIKQMDTPESIREKITNRQRLLYEEASLVRLSPEKEKLRADELAEVERVAGRIAEHMRFYSLGDNAPMEGLVRSLFHKTMSQMTLDNWRTMDRMFKYWRTPTALQKIFGSKYGEQAWIKKLDYFLFPEAINKELMKTWIELSDDFTGYIDADGVPREGYGLKPTHLVGMVQDRIGGVLDASTSDIEHIVDGEFREALMPYVFNLKEDGYSLFRYTAMKMNHAAAVKQAEGYYKAMKAAIAKGDEKAISDATRRHKNMAEAIKLWYADIKAFELENAALMTKSFDVNNGKEIVKMTSTEIYQKIRSTIASFNERSHKLLTGSDEIISRYVGKNPFGNDVLSRLDRRVAARLAAIEFYDVDKYNADVHRAIQEGKPLPSGVGIDGHSLIGRSSNLEHLIRTLVRTISDNDTLSKQVNIAINRFGAKPDPITRKIDYEDYFPQLNEDPEEIRARLMPYRDKLIAQWGPAKLVMEDAYKKLSDLENVEKSDLSPDALLGLADKIREARNVFYEAERRYNEIMSEYMHVINKLKNGENDYGSLISDKEDEMYWLMLERVKANKKEEQESLDKAIRWENSDQKVRNQMRREDGYGKYDMRPEAYMEYMRKIISMNYKKMALVGAKRDVMNAEERNLMGDATQSWVKFMKMYISDSLGNPSVMTDDLINDPDMKLQGNLYTSLTDSVVAKKLYGMFVKTGMIKENEKIPEELKSVDLQTVIRLSQLEAQYEMASLLAHPKSMFANIFGGSQMTAINAGLSNLRDARSIDYLRKNINPNFKDRSSVVKSLIEHGIVSEFIATETGVDGKSLGKTWQAFTEDLSNRFNSKSDVSAKVVAELAEKYHITDAMFDAASWFMRVSEIELRVDAFLSHYIYWDKMFGGAFKGNYDEDGNFRFNPFLSKMAKNGIQATQFFYTAPYRPAVARTALGKVLTRFQLWTYNSINTRNSIYQDAALYGFREGSEQMERFGRLVATDLVSLALAQAFMFSLFDSTLPAPMSWMADFADLIFGDEKERDAAFFGAYPQALAPLQIITPPIARMFPAMVSGMVSGDWRRITDYTVWTMFPFGRLARDLQKSYLNPKSFVDRMTGLPLTRLPSPTENNEKNIYIPGGIV